MVWLCSAFPKQVGSFNANAIGGLDSSPATKWPGADRALAPIAAPTIVSPEALPLHAFKVMAQGIMPLTSNYMRAFSHVLHSMSPGCDTNWPGRAPPRGPRQAQSPGQRLRHWPPEMPQLSEAAWLGFQSASPGSKNTVGAQALQDRKPFGFCTLAAFGRCGSAQPEPLSAGQVADAPSKANEKDPEITATSTTSRESYY